MIKCTECQADCVRTKECVDHNYKDFSTRSSWDAAKLKRKMGRRDGGDRRTFQYAVVIDRRQADRRTTDRRGKMRWRDAR
jgi:hypothetical protein